MTNSEMFKQAHAMTKATIKTGDNYQITFGAYLKFIKSGAKIVQTQEEQTKRDTVTCHSVGEGTIQVYWIEGKVYEVTRRTKSSFWVVDEVGF